MSPQQKSFRYILVIAMTLIIIGLLVWQEARFQLVSECHARGWQWDGARSRCRPLPKIYLERGIKRS